SDSNHRITTDYIDYIRLVRYYGYASEGVAMCSPTSTTPGGDLHAWFAFPGSETSPGAPLVYEFVSHNCAPAETTNALNTAGLPWEVPWTLSCTTLGGAACPAGLTAASLGAGLRVAALPPGGAVTIKAEGKAPPAGAELRASNAIVAPS